MRARNLLIHWCSVIYTSFIDCSLNWRFVDWPIQLIIQQILNCYSTIRFNPSNYSCAQFDSSISLRFNSLQQRRLYLSRAQQTCCRVRQTDSATWVLCPTNVILGASIWRHLLPKWSVGHESQFAEAVLQTRELFSQTQELASSTSTALRVSVNICFNELDIIWRGVGEMKALSWRWSSEVLLML